MQPIDVRSLGDLTGDQNALVAVEKTPSTLRPKQVTLFCVKCTRTARFGVTSVEETAREIAKAGWAQRGGRTICPRCPK